MRVVHVSSEVTPWSQTGGLADVVGAVPRALAQADAGVECAVFSPLYRGVRERARARGATLEPRGVSVHVPLAGEHLRVGIVTLRAGDAPPVHLVDCPRFFDRDGLYATAAQVDYADNPLRFALLCRAAIEAAPALMGGMPDVFHAHDWQAGLVPVYLRTRYPGVRAACVFTIHNLAYQGVYPKDMLPALDLDWTEVFRLDRMEHHDYLSLLKGGVAYADAVTTVSPSYAREILTPDFGNGLHDFLRHHARNLEGILNGIDTASWDPTHDPHLPAPYDAAHLDSGGGKAVCRRALARELGLAVAEDELLLGVVSRMADQKGLDLVSDLVPALHGLGARLVVLGSGEPALEARFRYLGRAFGQHVAVRIGFETALARRIFAGSDAMLIPSRFEPCGLNQMYAMRYGTVPIVHAVGGLRDTVRDPGGDALRRGQGTGFCFEHATAAGLHWAVERAARMFRADRAGWLAIARAGMASDWSWTRSARDYLQLYQRLGRRLGARA